jgi:hypothetical protein
VDFYTEEVASLKLTKVQPRLIQRLANGQPIVLRIGKAYYIINIIFLTNQKDTASKIETLRTQTGYLNCFYRYGIDAYTYVKTVQMVKAGIPTPYEIGHMAQGERIDCTFYESTSGKVSVQIDYIPYGIQ